MKKNDIIIIHGTDYKEMAKKKGGLGRGLESLFEDVSPSFEPDNAKIETLPLREIEPDPDQPRKTFDDETLAELASSIAEHGLIQPIAVRPKVSGGYLIVAGERRWRACRMAGLTEAPVVVKDVTDEQAMEIALVENLQREDLDPVEEAMGIRELMTRCDLTQEQAAQMIADHELNVRQAEVLCKKLARPAKGPAEPAPIDTLPVEVEESLKEVLGSEVNVAYHGGKGRLTVHFYSDEQLRAFANLLGQYQQSCD